MNSAFARRRQHLLALKAMRDGQAPQLSQATPCPKCGETVPRRDLVHARYVCPKCGHHYPVGAYYRLSLILDAGSFRELDGRLTATDPFRFPGYGKKLAETKARTGLNEAVVTAAGTIEGRKVAIGVLDSRFFMGSMSAAVGEKVTRLIEYAEKNKLPLVIFSASGGARMQEGILSLMQMAKTSAALERFSQKGGLYISVLTDPTTGGAWATSPWPSRGPSSASPGPGSSSRPSARLSPTASSGRNIWRSTASWTPSSPGPNCGRPWPAS